MRHHRSGCRLLRGRGGPSEISPVADTTGIPFGRFTVPLVERLPAGLPERLFLADSDILDRVDLADAATDFKLTLSESRSLEPLAGV